MSAASDAYAPVAPGGVVGVLGGGQLGRMLAAAAARLGLKTHIYCPEEDAPASACAARTFVGSYTDEVALAAFQRSVDVVTYEFENVPAETAAILAGLGAPVAPGANALAVAQDRLEEKTFARALGAQTAPFGAVDGPDDLVRAADEIGLPAILKSRRFGYDGKGQAPLRAADDEWRGDPARAAEKAWAAVGGVPSIIEGFVDFVAEFSIVGARSRGGAVRLYPPARNDHASGVLRRSEYPAGVDAGAAARAEAFTERLLAELDYVGVVAVEFFLTGDGQVLVNEFAPRVHNSGHWTIDACACSQFEQHIRAVCGWPLGDPTPHAGAVMENLLGDDAADWRRLAETDGLQIHLYGKSAAAPGRKMGHTTRLTPAPHA